MSLSVFLSVIDGCEIIKVIGFDLRTLYEGKKVDCPYFDADVIGAYTVSGQLVINVAY